MTKEQIKQVHAAVTHKTVRAQSFVLVDEAFRERAELKVINDGLGNDDTVLMMRDAKGRLRLTLRGGASEATVNVFGEGADNETIDLLGIGWAMGDQTPFIKFYGRDGEGEATVTRNMVATRILAAAVNDLPVVFDNGGVGGDVDGDEGDDDDELPPLDTEEALRDIRRFIKDPVNGRLEDESAWPSDLTLGQMLHQCGYLMHAILDHPDAPEEVRAGFVGLLGTLRANLAEKDAERLAAIDAGVLFARIALELSHHQQAPQ